MHMIRTDTQSIEDAQCKKKTGLKLKMHILFNVLTYSI